MFSPSDDRFDSIPFEGGADWNPAAWWRQVDVAGLDQAG
jgi:hypothetical protein